MACNILQCGSTTNDGRGHKVNYTAGDTHIIYWYTMNSEQTYKLEIQSIKKYTLNTVKKLKEEKEQNIKQYSSNPEIVNKGEKKKQKPERGKNARQQT